MNEKFLKPYNPAETEKRIYKLWEESGFFNPDICIEKGITKSDAEVFSMVLPPPNVTGRLHLGHALEHSLQDTIVRFERMRGKRTLWIPGTDHAAIATQARFEKDLNSKEGKSRHDFSREEFFEMVHKFGLENQKHMQEQMRLLGSSLDWSREAFTLDEKRSLAVRTAFKQMYEEKLIYRGHRIVNWDPKGQTTISDDEIVYEEQKTNFYYFQYGPFVIGTARPETKFGDKYVVMHPDDKRYKKYKHGDKVELEWISGPITATIIKDKAIDMKFGTGVMTITPWHDVVDFEIAERHNLDKEQIIDKYGKLLPIAGEFAGMKIKDAREKMVEKLKAKNLLVKIEENYVNRIATAERTGGIIEPQIMLQWFVNVNKPIPSRKNKSLKSLMLEPVEKNEIEVLPEHFKKVYSNWIDNLHDWCISRQIIYGHQVPVWYREKEIYCGIDAPSVEGWTQDTDTLDTWFSAGLWTFSTLGWPEKTKDMQTFHPTSFMDPAYEILFFWVARMIMMSQYLLGEIPFKKVYLHGIVRDKTGKKFSKSNKNGVEPEEIIAQFGTDALRMSMLVGNAPGMDINFDVQKVKAYKNFANKLWNIARFIQSSVENTDMDSVLSPIDDRLYERFQEILKDFTKDIEALRLHIASEKIYHYVWHEFADKIIEESKVILKNENPSNQLEINSKKRLLLEIFEGSLKALHPFMPFVTEEIWQNIGKEKLLLVEKWPV